MRRASGPEFRHKIMSGACTRPYDCPPNDLRRGMVREVIPVKDCQITLQIGFRAADERFEVKDRWPLRNEMNVRSNGKMGTLCLVANLGGKQAYLE